MRHREGPDIVILSVYAPEDYKWIAMWQTADSMYVVGSICGGAYWIQCNVAANSRVRDAGEQSRRAKGITYVQVEHAEEKTRNGMRRGRDA